MKWYHFQRFMQITFSKQIKMQAWLANHFMLERNTQAVIIDEIRRLKGQNAVVIKLLQLSHDVLECMCAKTSCLSWLCLIRTETISKIWSSAYTYCFKNFGAHMIEKYRCTHALFFWNENDLFTQRFVHGYVWLHRYDNAALEMIFQISIRLE